ncbi:hypothetical protein ACP3P6_07180 [Enterobacter mori]
MEGFDTAAMALSGLIRKGMKRQPRNGAHLQKTAAGKEHLGNLGENRVAAAVSDLVAMFF